MAVYTRLTIDEVNEIMSRFGIKGITYYEELSGGSQNSNYHVKTLDNEYVISICEQSSTEEVHQLGQLMDHLAEHNFTTSKVIRMLDGESISSWNDKPVMVKQFIKGKVLENIPNNITKLVGEELGKLHQVPAPDYLPKAMSYGIDYFQEVEEYAAGSEYQNWLYEKQNYIESHISASLPKSLIHSDVFSSNVIIDESEEFVTIMDFEEAAHYYRVFDVGMTIIGICREGESINFSKTKTLLKGYNSVVQFTQEELDSLQAFVVYAATAMSFWRHKNFHYTVPTPALYNHYKELKFIADSVFAIKPDAFFKLLN